MKKICLLVVMGIILCGMYGMECTTMATDYQYGEYLHYEIYCPYVPGVLYPPQYIRIIKCDVDAENITIPSKINNLTVKYIGQSAFSGCVNLKNIHIPDSVTSIGNNSFSGCTSLQKVTLPNSLDSLSSSVFSGCSSLGEITLPASVTQIGNYAFSGCSSLKEITFPNSVTNVGDYAFAYCTNLKEVKFGSGIEIVGASSFDYCSKITSLSVPDINSYVNIEFGNIYSNPLFYAKKLLVNDELIDTLIINNGVTDIKSYAFVNCLSLKNIVIPKSLENIENRAFLGCDTLECVVYFGNSEEWNKVTIGMENDALSSLHVQCVDGEFYYVVKHFRQNIEDDDYALWETEVKSAELNDYVTIEGKKYTGFTMNQSIGRLEGNIIDNSSVFECYYDRDSCTIEYNTNGGAILPGTTVKYGEKVLLPNPVKYGYKFAGWYTENEYLNLVTEFYVAEREQTLYAKWNEIDETVVANEYRINDLSLRSATNYEKIDEIPDDSFIAEISFTNIMSKGNDTVIIASYDKNDTLLGLTYQYVSTEIGRTYIIGTYIKNDGEVAKIKCFIWPTLCMNIPLANSIEIAFK